MIPRRGRGAECAVLSSLFSAQRTWGGDDGKEGKRRGKGGKEERAERNKGGEPIGCLVRALPMTRSIPSWGGVQVVKWPVTNWNAPAVGGGAARPRPWPWPCTFPAPRPAPRCTPAAALHLAGLGLTPSMKRGCLLVNLLQTKDSTALLVFVLGILPCDRSFPPNEAHALWHHHVGGAHFWLPFSLVVCAASQLHGFATSLLSALPERQNARTPTLCNRLMEERCLER
jgi:hypothetical protein